VKAPQLIFGPFKITGTTIRSPKNKVSIYVINQVRNSYYLKLKISFQMLLNCHSVNLRFIGSIMLDCLQQITGGKGADLLCSG
jgi:hypothetical protein